MEKGINFNKINLDISQNEITFASQVSRYYKLVIIDWLYPKICRIT